MTPPPAARAADGEGVDVRRSADRPVSEHAPGAWATHSFSFGSYYDPANLGFGPLVCHDDHRLAPASGYDDHPHADLEIVTWVLDGALVHRSPTLDGDTAPRHGPLGPGRAQVLSAGSGVVHAETGDADAGTTRFVQTWLRPDVPGATPSYARTAEVDASPGLTAVAGAGAEVGVGVAGATLWVARGGGELRLPDAGRLHLYLPRGSADLEEGVTLAAGDAVRLVDAGGVRLLLDPGAEALVWSFR